MRFIELKPGIYVKKEDIIAIEEIDMMTCKVLTPVGAYDSIYPSWRILMLLEEDMNEPVAPEPPVDRVNLWGKQYFAG
jgi:hypothetical protein